MPLATTRARIMEALAVMPPGQGLTPERIAERTGLGRYQRYHALKKACGHGLVERVTIQGRQVYRLTRTGRDLIERCLHEVSYGADTSAAERI